MALVDVVGKADGARRVSAISIFTYPSALTPHKLISGNHRPRPRHQGGLDSPSYHSFRSLSALHVSYRTEHASISDFQERLAIGFLGTTRHTSLPKLEAVALLNCRLCRIFTSHMRLPRCRL